MKPLLLTLSFLLLSLPSFGHKEGKHILYKWETSSGIRWKSFGDEEIHDKYEGEIKNNLPNGLGSIFFNENNSEYFGKYIGEWKDGIRNGLGTLIWDNFKYEGEWKNDLWDGVGKVIDDENVIEGEWTEGFSNGKQKYTYPDGYIFEGFFKMGKLESVDEKYLTKKNEQIDYVTKFQTGMLGDKKFIKYKIEFLFENKLIEKIFLRRFYSYRIITQNHFDKFKYNKNSLEDDIIKLSNNLKKEFIKFTIKEYQFLKGFKLIHDLKIIEYQII